MSDNVYIFWFWALPFLFYAGMLIGTTAAFGGGLLQILIVVLFLFHYFGMFWTRNVVEDRIYEDAERGYADERERVQQAENL